MVVPNKLTKYDLHLAFSFLKNNELRLVKIIANPMFERFLSEAGVGVAVEMDETRIGLDFIGESQNTDERVIFSIRVCDTDSFNLFHDIVSSVDSKQIRLWKWANSPECLRQFADSGIQGRWIALIPPDLFGESLDWMDSSMFGYAPDFYMLPGGWQVFYSVR